MIQQNLVLQKEIENKSKPMNIRVICIKTCDTMRCLPHSRVTVVYFSWWSDEQPFINFVKETPNHMVKISTADSLQYYISQSLMQKYT